MNITKKLTFLSVIRLALCMNITVDSFQAAYPPSNAIDGVSSTIWHSRWSPGLAKLPHVAYIDLGQSSVINGFTYLPRQDTSNNGNIGQHSVELSPDNSTWTLAANSTFADNKLKKTTAFKPASARYIRFTAFTEAGNRGSWSGAAEFGVSLGSNSTSLGQWGPVINFPLVPAAAFLIPNSGKVLTFSAFATNAYSTTGHGYTMTAVYDPSTGSVSQRNVSNTQHDMFCPGLSLDSNGRAVVTGGDNAARTSIYDAPTDTWISGPDMKIPRGYQSSSTLSDGRIFTIGGSWNGGKGGKNGEIYNTTSNTWSLLSGCLVAPMLTADAGGIFRQDDHAWLFGWKSGSVFQAGPSKAMNWYGTTGNGSRSAAGVRAADPDAMNANAIMYDAVNGMILTAGGSPSYQKSNATSNVHLISIGNPGTAATVRKLTSMSYKRAFANGVILPNGQVVIIGGQPYAVPFTDTDAVMTPELWDPVTQKFTILPPHSIPRTYHSIALLLLDGRVLSGGGGLCSGTCATNHQDAQIFSPSYLFNADGTLASRPTITSVTPRAPGVGTNIVVSCGGAVSSFSLIRYGSSTHTVDTDQRRIALTPVSTVGTTYTLTIPSDPGIALPGYWMLFALDAAGVPSVAQSIRITL